jgi:anti-sigma B factor antagonist
MTPLDIERRKDSQGRDVIAVRGEIDVATSPTLRDELYTVIDGGSTALVVDLSGLGFIDSSGLGVLVGSLKHMRERDGQLVIAGLEQPARRVFEITGLTELFPMEPAAS